MIPAKRVLKWILGIASIVIMVLCSLPGWFYYVGLAVVPDFPTPPAIRAQTIPQPRAESAGGGGYFVASRYTFVMDKLNPWQYAYHIVFRCKRPFESSADLHECVYFFRGHMAAWSAANEHLNNGDVTMVRSFTQELATTALSIWITRNWSPEQIDSFRARARQ